MKTVDMQPRVLPYKKKNYQIAITYEIDASKYSIYRIETTYFDWLSAVGGFSSILLGMA